MKKIIIAAVLLTVSTQKSKSAEVHFSLLQSSCAICKSELGESLTVINEKALDKKNLTSISDAIKGIEGVNITQSGVSGNSSVYINGQKSEYTSIMVDGIEINDPMTIARTADISVINPLALQEIEVLSNPLSGTYGSNAMGGSINLITIPSEPGMKITTAYDSWGMLNSIATIFREHSNFSFFLSGSNMKAGISKARASNNETLEKDAYTNNTLAARIKANLSQETKAEFYFRNINTENDLDAGAYNQDPNYTSKENYNISKIAISRNISNFWTTELVGDYLYSRRIYKNQADSESQDIEDSWYHGKNILLKSDNIFSLKSNILAEVFLEYKKETGSSYSFSDGQWGPYTSSFIERIQNEKSAGASACFFVKNFTFSAASRLSQNELFGRYDSHNFYSSYSFSERFLIKTSFGASLKIPSLFQLYSSYGNTELKPTKTDSFNAGSWIKFFKDSIHLSYGYFRNISRNLIDYDWTSWKYQNIGKTRSEGFNVGLHTIISKLSMDINYSRLSAKDTVKNTFLLRQPKNTWHMQTTYSAWKDLEVNFSSFYKGSRKDIDSNGQNVTVKNYVKSDLSINYIFKDANIKVGINNIFNADYQDIYGYYYPRRSFYTSLTMKI